MDSNTKLHKFAFLTAEYKEIGNNGPKIVIGNILMAFILIISKSVLILILRLKLLNFVITLINSS